MTMRAFQRAPISRFVLFLTIAVTSALALTTNAGRALGPKAHAAPAAQNVPQTFTWSMAKRFGPKRPDGIVDFHWNEISHSYEDTYVNPKTWRVDFKACLPGDQPTTKFALVVNGNQVAQPPSCEFSHEFGQQGVYDVKV